MLCDPRSSHAQSRVRDGMQAMTPVASIQAWVWLWQRTLERCAGVSLDRATVHVVSKGERGSVGKWLQDDATLAKSPVCVSPEIRSKARPMAPFQ